MIRNELRRVAPGLILMASLGLVACDGGNDGMGGVEEEGMGTGAGTYEDPAQRSTTPYSEPDTVDQRRPAMDEPAGAGGINDDMRGTGTGDAWDDRMDVPDSDQLPAEEPLHDAVTPEQGTQAPPQP